MRLLLLGSPARFRVARFVCSFSLLLRSFFCVFCVFDLYQNIVFCSFRCLFFVPFVFLLLLDVLLSETLCSRPLGCKRFCCGTCTGFCETLFMSFSEELLLVSPSPDPRAVGRDMQYWSVRACFAGMHAVTLNSRNVGVGCGDVIGTDVFDVGGDDAVILHTYCVVDAVVIVVTALWMLLSS